MPPASQPKPALIIWITMGTSHLLFLGLGAMMAPVANPDAVATAQALALPAMMTASASIALGVIPALLPGTPGFTRNILRWALAESASLFGLVALLVCGEALYQYAYALFGMIAWAVAFPKDDLPPVAG